MDKISGVILLGDKDEYIKASLYKWLGMRRIYLINMKFMISNFCLTSSSIDNNYIDQFRYTQHVVMRGPIIDDMAIFIISHCPCLLSIDIGDCKISSLQITDRTLHSIAQHCTGLQSLQLLKTGGCYSLSSDVLRNHFKSVSKLRAVLCLSIYPSLPI